MPDEPTYTPPPGFLAAIERELRPVAETAARAKGVAYKCREQLIELCGQSGKNGEIGRMQKDIAENKEGLKANRKMIFKLILIMASASASGAAASHALIKIL